MTEKRRVQVTANTRKVDNRTELFYRAKTLLGSKTVFADGPDEKGAVSALQSKVEQREAIADIKAGYPKTIEVDW